MKISYSWQCVQTLDGKASILFFYLFDFFIKIELYWIVKVCVTVRHYALWKKLKSNGLFWVLGFIGCQENEIFSCRLGFNIFPPCKRSFPEKPRENDIGNMCCLHIDWVFFRTHGSTHGILSDIRIIFYMSH